MSTPKGPRGLTPVQAERVALLKASEIDPDDHADWVYSSEEPSLEDILRAVEIVTGETRPSRRGSA